MSLERYPPDDPREWLRFARGDAALARAEVPGVPYELLCFHAQQAAEKAIKAVLLAAGVKFPRTHNLVRLLDLLEEGGVAVPAAVREAGPLTIYAVVARYPLPEPGSSEELVCAVATADTVIRWAQGRIDPEPASGPAPQEAP